MPTMSATAASQRHEAASSSEPAIASDCAGRFYDTYFPLVYGYFRRRTRDVATAEDLTADTFGRIVAALPQFKPGDDPDRSARVWVYRIAGNVFKNALRTEGRRAARHDRWGRDESHVADSRASLERRFAIDGAMAKLDPSDREIVRLRYWDDLTAAEIGEVVDMKQREVYTALERCVRQLRKSLDNTHLRGET